MAFEIICFAGFLFVVVALPFALRKPRAPYRRPPCVVAPEMCRPERNEPPLPMPLVPQNQTEYNQMAFYWSQNPEKYPYPVPPVGGFEND